MQEKSSFHLFQRVTILEGEYILLGGVVERIILDGENKGIWVEIDDRPGLHCFQPEHIQAECEEDATRQRREHEIALREGGYYHCFPEKDS